jgi:hypothetical protein
MSLSRFVKFLLVICVGSTVALALQVTRDSQYIEGIANAHFRGGTRKECLDNLIAYVAKLRTQVRPQQYPFLVRLEAAVCFPSARTVAEYGDFCGSSCSDYTRLLMVLLDQVKIPSRRLNLRGDFTHQMPEVLMDGRWIPVDIDYGGFRWHRGDGQDATLRDIQDSRSVSGQILFNEPGYIYDFSRATHHFCFMGSQYMEHLFRMVYGSRIAERLEPMYFLVNYPRRMLLILVSSFTLSLFLLLVTVRRNSLRKWIFALSLVSIGSAFASPLFCSSLTPVVLLLFGFILLGMTYLLSASSAKFLSQKGTENPTAR